MSTFIINLNDTVAFSDSTVIELAKLVNSSQPIIQEAATNSNGIWITSIICLTVVVLAGIVALVLHLENNRKCQHDEDVKKSKEAMKDIGDLKQRVEKLENKFELPNDEKKADNFIEFCQNCKSFEDKMADKCIAIYEDLMKKRLKV